VSDKPPDLSALMKGLGGAMGGGKKAPAPQQAPSDGIDKGPKQSGIERLGSKTGTAAGERDLTVRPPAEGLVAQKELERLKILTRAPIYQQAQKRWLEKLASKLQMPGPLAARKLGFGPWKMKYESKTLLAAALVHNIGPVFAKQLGFDVRALTEAGEDRYAMAFVDVPGEPPLHPQYALDAPAFELLINQDDIKHVCHGYVMLVCHAWFRSLVERKRSNGMDSAVDATHGLTPEHVFVLEVNMCQHYVPASSAAYFEGQPIRALGREVANTFRKLAFGGQ
jgi:hypothetical protein